MAKIKLGNRPKTFKFNVEVVLPEGGKGSVEMVYKYRTRTEFGVFLDELFKTAEMQVKDQSEDNVIVSIAEALAKTKDQNADYIMAIAEGWNLEDEFTHANVAQLCDELPGVAMAIINTYRQAVAEGRLGN